MSEQYVIEWPGLPYFWVISLSPVAFLVLIFLSTESSYSGVNGPSLMSNCLLIILVISSCVTFCGFPSRFSKCCFHCFIHSCWCGNFQFSFGSALPSAHFVYRLPCYPRLPIFLWVSNLIWFSMYSVCSFRYMFANSFCPFFSFRSFVLVGFFLLDLEAVFTFTRFSLTANVSHGTLDFVLCFIGMYFAAACKWVLTKFSYSSFGVCVSVFSCSASNLFLNAITYLSLISLLLRRALS